jgi:hypothetical protein
MLILTPIACSKPLLEQAWFGAPTRGTTAIAAFRA